MEMDTKKWETDRDISEMVRAAERGELAPTCETCPLFGLKPYSGVLVCLHTSTQAIQKRGWNPAPQWFCEHHPLYPAWAMGECLRRVQKAGGAK